MRLCCCERAGAVAWQHRFELAALVVGKGHSAVFVAFFLLYGVPDDEMVSTIIFTRPDYRDAMTAFACLECAITACYGLRFRNIDAVGAGFVFAWAAAALAGWATLAYHSDTQTHFTGVGVYVASNAFCWILLLYLTKPFHGGLHAYDLGVYACVLATFALAGGFLLMYEDGDPPGCWLVEQLALLAHILSFTAFFSMHSWDPCKPFGGSGWAYHVTPLGPI